MYEFLNVRPNKKKLNHQTVRSMGKFTYKLYRNIIPLISFFRDEIVFLAIGSVNGVDWDIFRQ